MIRGIHGLYFTSEPEAMRAFLRDKLQLPFTDTGGGWLIFDLPEAEVGVHPTDPSHAPRSGTHDVSFYCDDIHGTVAELRARGVVFDKDVASEDFGYVTSFTMPGGVRATLYEPRYHQRSREPEPRPKPARRSSSRKPTTRSGKARRGY